LITTAALLLRSRARVIDMAAVSRACQANSSRYVFGNRIQSVLAISR
jgi:hypothetical protein